MRKPYELALIFISIIVGCVSVMMAKFNVDPNNETWLYCVGCLTVIIGLAVNEVSRRKIVRKDEVYFFYCPHVIIAIAIGCIITAGVFKFQSNPFAKAWILSFGCYVLLLGVIQFTMWKYFENEVKSPAD